MTTFNKMTLSCVLALAATATAVMAADAADEAGWDTSLALGANLNQGNTDNMGINAALTTARDY